MAAAASVCYPREAVEIGGAGWQTVTDFVKTVYQDNFACEYFLCLVFFFLEVHIIGEIAIFNNKLSCEH